MTMTVTIPSLESSCLAICSPLHVSVHWRLFFIQSVQEASTFTCSKYHDCCSRRSPSFSFVCSMARYTATDASRSNCFRWPSVADRWTPHNYDLNIISSHSVLCHCQQTTFLIQFKHQLVICLNSIENIFQNSYPWFSIVVRVCSSHCFITSKGWFTIRR